MRKILKTDLLFTGLEKEPKEGFVLIENNRIVKVGNISELEQSVLKDAEVLDLYGKVVSPGFVDNHVFFTGYIWQRIGFDASLVNSEKDLLELVEREAVIFK